MSFLRKMTAGSSSAASANNNSSGASSAATAASITVQSSSTTINPSTSSSAIAPLNNGADSVQVAATLLDEASIVKTSGAHQYQSVSNMTTQAITAGVVPLTPREKLAEAVREGNVPRIKKLLKQHPKLTLQNYDPLNGWSSLHVAACENQVEVLDFLIDAGHDVNEISRDIYSNTPLMIAIRYGNMEAMEKLIERCSNSLTMTNKDGWHAGHVAARYGHDKMLQMLIEKNLDMEQRDKEGCTPLHYAAAFGISKCVNILIDHGCENTPNNKGWSPRDWAFSWKLDAQMQEMARKKPKKKSDVKK